MNGDVRRWHHTLVSPGLSLLTVDAAAWNITAANLTAGESQAAISSLSLRFRWSSLWPRWSCLCDLFTDLLIDLVSPDVSLLTVDAGAWNISAANLTAGESLASHSSAHCLWPSHWSSLWSDLLFHLLSDRIIDLLADLLLVPQLVWLRVTSPWPTWPAAREPQLMTWSESAIVRWAAAEQSEQQRVKNRRGGQSELWQKSEEMCRKMYLDETVWFRFRLRFRILRIQSRSGCRRSRMEINGWRMKEEDGWRIKVIGEWERKGIEIKLADWS